MSCHISACPITSTHRHTHHYTPISVTIIYLSQKYPHTNSCDSGSVPSWTVESFRKLQILFARFAAFELCRHGFAVTAKPAGLAWVTANARIFCGFGNSFACFCILLSTCLDGNSTLFIQANLKSCKFLSWLIVNVKAQIATVVRKLL